MNKLCQYSLLLALCVACGKKPNKSTNHSQNIKSLSKITLISDRIFFDFDSDKLNEEAINIVKSQAKFLKSQKHTDCIVIEGHADERGTVEYNIILGKRRGNAFASELRKNGFKGIIKVISYGKERPETIGASSEILHAMNRRAVIS